MGEFLLTVVIGLMATAVMTTALYLIHWRGFSNADMIRALGSIVTRDENRALVPGLVIHYVSGVVFAFLYLLFWSTLQFQTFSFYLILGLLTGTVHGLVVSFLLVILVAEHHPLERFQDAGLGVAVAHWVGHVIYGVVVGGLAGAALLRYEFVPLVGQVSGW